jgi:hypothetical protein
MKKIKRLLDWLIIVFLAILFLGCQSGKSLNRSSIYSHIEEFSISPDGEKIALVISDGEYNRQLLGLEDWRLIVTNVSTQSIVTEIQGTDNAPISLNWATDSEALYYILPSSNIIKNSLEVIYLNNDTVHSQPFPYTGFVYSHTGHAIIAWELTYQERLRQTIGTKFHVIDPSTFQVQEVIDTNASQSVRRIEDIVWSFDDLFLMLFVTFEDSHRGFLKYSIEDKTFEEIKVEIDDSLYSNLGANWNSIENWIAVATFDKIVVYSIDNECFIDEIVTNNITPIEWVNNSRQLIFRKDYGPIRNTNQLKEVQILDTPCR